jgi:hypothetical protein
MYKGARGSGQAGREDNSELESESITIQIRMNGTTSQNFRIAKSVLTVAIVLTLVSAIWGSGMASWLAWNEISGVESERDTVRAKLVADEVTKAISVNGALAKSDKDILREIRDSVARFVGAGISNGSARQSDSESENVFAAEKSREHRTWRRVTSESAPMMNLPVKGLSVPEPMKLESVSYFKLRQSDILRVDLAHSLEKLISGEISIIGKYRVGGVDKIVGCCGEVLVTSPDDVSTSSGVQFRAMFRARKHIELARPDIAGATLVAVKVGVLTSAHPDAKYTPWIAVDRLKADALSLAVGGDIPRKLPAKLKVTTRGKIPVQEMEKTFVDEMASEGEADVRHFPGDESEAYDAMANSTAEFHDSGTESPISNAMRILSKLRPATVEVDEEY